MYGAVRLVMVLIMTVVVELALLIHALPMDFNLVA